VDYINDIYNCWGGYADSLLGLWLLYEVPELAYIRFLAAMIEPGEKRTIGSG
jgi:hypothetical protein